MNTEQLIELQSMLLKIHGNRTDSYKVRNTTEAALRLVRSEIEKQSEGEKCKQNN